ncbi:MAG: uroporphyrinogen-III synthase, partial [Candidatus Nanopelagicales bacterium]|nr:uroporphyrinogen-III synthase [Candidatus Nanopelagicales bacterium]
GLVAELPGPPTSILFPHGSIAMRALPDDLSAAGWTVHEGVVYETSVVEHEPVSTVLLRDERISAIILRSPSAARAVLQHFGTAPSAPVVVSGPTTAAAAEALGFTVAAISESPAAAHMAEAVRGVITA